ncbi:DUF1080 domain-containing protein [Candidatus Poribacteria bacterium]|nr:DUF1080 domain-containing protein [Candidatus Poribacteria bacterium]
MKKTIYSIFILFIILSLSDCSSSAGIILFYDDFSSYDPGSDGFPMWIARSGEWEVTEEGYKGTDCEETGYICHGVTTGRKEWSDYSLSLELKIISQGSDWRDGPWISFRHADSKNTYTVGFYDRLSALHKISRGVSTGDGSALTQSNKTIKDNEWHNLRINIKDTQIAVILDGNTIMRVNDKEWNDTPPVEAGGISLCARKYPESEGNTVVVFRNVKVESIGKASDLMKYTMEDAKAAAGDIISGNIKVSPLDFLKKRSNRRYTKVPRKVLAFYYTWYGRPENHGNWVHWGKVNPKAHDISASTHYPALGAYDSHDPEIINKHIQMAKDNGIDGFICTWWGQGTFDDNAFKKVLERAKENNFKVSLYWETAPGKARAKITKAVDDLVYILEKYGSNPAFLKVEGKPVIFIYGRVMAQVSMDEWPEIISMTRRLYGSDFVLIADGYKESYARMFDGIHTYNICSWVQKKTPDELRKLSEQSFNNAVKIAKKNARISCITIIPGYDDTKIRMPGIKAERMDGKTYSILWEEAIATDPDWILITSWNEWHEGSEIEPSWEHGDKYLKITGEYASEFKETQYSQVVIPETKYQLSPDKIESLKNLYEGKTIAILPDFSSEAVFWLANMDFNLKELKWEDLLDSENFNAEKYPILVYASGERYTQTLRDKGDIDKAIIRYQKQGGMLMALASLPFPFFYNQDGVASGSAKRFGFTIEGGWENPPDDVNLTFKINTDILTSLPSSVPFPESGDLRWRPSSISNTQEGDIYIPLATLLDDNGKSYGDGIVYVEHKVSEPKNGKNIYAWMRMMDILDTEYVLYELFHLAGEKITHTETR